MWVKRKSLSGKEKQRILCRITPFSKKGNHVHLERFSSLDSLILGFAWKNNLNWHSLAHSKCSIFTHKVLLQTTAPPLLDIQTCRMSVESIQRHSNQEPPLCRRLWCRDILQRHFTSQTYFEVPYSFFLTENQEKRQWEISSTSITWWIHSPTLLRAQKHLICSSCG